MEKSRLENIGNVQLYFLLKSVIDLYSGKIGNEIGDEEFRDACDNAGKIIGLTNLDYLDYNYINACIIINNNFDFTTPKPLGVLKRPEAGLYSFDIDEHRIENVRRTYTHEMTSYLEQLLNPMVTGMEQDGNFDYYEGRESDVDYYDGETTDIIFDKKSIRKIK